MNRLEEVSNEGMWMKKKNDLRDRPKAEKKEMMVMVTKKKDEEEGGGGEEEEEEKDTYL